LAGLQPFLRYCAEVRKAHKLDRSRTPPPLDLIGMQMVGKKPANAGLGTSIPEALFRQQHAKLTIASDGPCPTVSIRRAKEPAGRRSRSLAQAV